VNEEDKPGSLADQAAAWIPPWQRPASAGPATPAVVEQPESGQPESGQPESGQPESEISEAGLSEAESIDARVPETASLGGDHAAIDDETASDEPRPETGPDDEDEPEEQRPETDRLADPTPDGDVVRSSDAGSDADPDLDPDEDDEPDEQRPETDRLVDLPTGSDASDRDDSGTGTDPDEDDDEPDEQRPETDRLADFIPSADPLLAEIDALDAEPVSDGTADAGPAVFGIVSDAVTRTREEDSAESDRPANLSAALEAILLVVDVPVSTDVLAEVLGVSVAEAGAALAALSAEYTEAGRGIDLRRAAGGWRLYTREDYARYVERFVLDGQSVRITQAALETLAVIAYQQPVTRSRMSAIRGVNCDGVVRTLANRGLIEECGTQPDSGAFLYRTTPLFLEKLGLDSLDELPPLAPFLPDDVNGFVDA
jgi:segregation and condensation protein B